MSSPRLPSSSTMPGRPMRTKPSSPGAATLTAALKRVGLAGLLVMVVWWIYVWRSGVIQDFFDPNDKVQAHRPDFRYVAPYSPQHRYRPAASPIITERKGGKIQYRGKYIT